MPILTNVPTALHFKYRQVMQAAAMPKWDKCGCSVNKNSPFVVGSFALPFNMASWCTLSHSAKASSAPPTKAYFPASPAKTCGLVARASSSASITLTVMANVSPPKMKLVMTASPSPALPRKR